jgi:hypothetical protein
MKSYRKRVLEIYPGAFLMTSICGEGMVYIVDTYKAYAILAIKNAFYDAELFEKYKTTIWKDLWTKIQTELENKLAK